MLIDGWRDAFKLWSVRVQAFGLALLALIEAFPEALVSTWAMLPPDMRTQVPEDLVRWFAFGVLAAGILTRLLKQRRLRHETID